MNHEQPQPSQLEIGLSRRTVLHTATAASLTLALPRMSFAAAGTLKKPVRIGVIADLHHDVMHDGADRLDVFLDRMSVNKPDAILQLGDFAYPKAGNAEIINRFNQAHKQSLHVIGNHDTDAGCTTDQCIEMWGMPGRYYTQDIEGLQLLVLDGNDAGSPTHKGGYASYVGPEQVEWLKAQLKTLDGPIIVASHQPLAGAYPVDNADEIQAILGDAANKVILVINGHSHIDEVVRVKNVTYLHVNSASYKWVGSDNRHESYSEDIHEKHPWISCTCPYRDSLYAMLTVDPENSTIRVTGTSSSWVGKSPAELGLDLHPELTSGEEIAPRIRDREFIQVRS
ncbi:MAG: metallophosphoesterase [Phycisphaerales bacterium]|nr:metallophosphoesterase [Phycisphaerales bacterium]